MYHELRKRGTSALTKPRHWFYSPHGPPIIREACSGPPRGSRAHHRSHIQQLPFSCWGSARAPSMRDAHGVPITAEAAQLIAVSIHTSNAWLLFRATAASARAICGTGVLETPVGVSAIRDFLAHRLFCAWRLTCKCWSRFPLRLACFHGAHCPRMPNTSGARGVPTGRTVVPTAATLHGSNAGRILQSIPIAPAINGTAAAEGIRAGASGIRSPAGQASAV